MSQSLSNGELKYTLIKKHAFSLVKAIKKFRHFNLGKHMQVKVPLFVVTFLLSGVCKKLRVSFGALDAIEN